MHSRREGRFSITMAVVLAMGLALGAAAPQLRADDSVESSAEEASENTARAALRKTTDSVLAVIEEARDYVDEDPERYYSAVHEVLDPFVDFRGFARGVMGEYATGSRYRGLDEAGRDKLRDQLDRFTETMRKGLVRTYSKGLLAFGGSSVELDDSDNADDTPSRATLRQLIYSDAAKPYVVVYLMAKNQSGDWQMRNLIVENVNLGQIYRSQFESAARRYDGDLDKVIDNWTVDDATD